MAETDDAKEKAADEEATDGIKRVKHRSPNYPIIGLRKAEERVKTLHDKYKRNLVPVSLAQEAWNYKAHSGAGNQSVAALRSFGLLDVEGDGKGRRVRVSDSAYKILLNSPDRARLLKEAAHGPTLYRELWDKYEEEGSFPEPQLIRHYLLFDREEGTFNADSVDSFIANLLDSFRYAGLLAGSTIDGNGGGLLDARTAGEPPSICAGDYVQWTSAGVDQFNESRRVVGISDDGQWAFIEGSATGVPMNELNLQHSPRGDPTPPKSDPSRPLPPNPFLKTVAPSPSAPSALPPGAVEERTNLIEGPVILQLPASLAADSVADLEDWLNGLIRRARRKAGLPPDQPKT